MNAELFIIEYTYRHIIENYCSVKYRIANLNFSEEKFNFDLLSGAETRNNSGVREYCNCL